ncbi:MAG: hypothetical protein C0597_05765 [Marinilabiliales bacterium]|nr:MAG: hypothetical protein C0597_05765 [Marinilabiliales bacterium]
MIVGIAAIMLLSSCANKEYVEACLEGYRYGFWGGLWHGIIAPIDLVISLFRDDVTVYAQNNNGAWYAFGFILGSGGWGILGSKGASGKRRRSKKYD